jgi:hypothetical protein
MGLGTMTSIKPERLAKEVEEIQNLITDPPRLRSRIVNVLEFYSDRTRRSQTAIRSKGGGRKFGVPSPVMKALERALRQSIVEDPAYASEISEALWQVKYRESRLLAIALLDQNPLNLLLEKVENWSQETKDYEVLGKMAEILIDQWGREGYVDFSEGLSNWLESETLTHKLLAILAMHAAARDPGFEDIPQIFYLIRVHEVVGYSQLHRGLNDLLRSLIQRSSSETARFLFDVFELNQFNGRRLVKELLPDFPSDDQRRLRQVLST